MASNVLDDLGITREDVAEIARKREAHLQRLITVANEAVEYVRHAPNCPGLNQGDEQCSCGAVEYLSRVSAAILNK